MVRDEVGVVQHSTGLGARRVRREPVLDRGSLVRVAVGADDGVLHGLTRGAAEEDDGHRIVHLQGRGALPCPRSEPMLERDSVQT